MPKFFKSKHEKLYIEAAATFLLIDSLLAGNLVLHATNRMIKIHRMAQNRAARRFRMTFGR